MSWQLQQAKAKFSDLVQKAIDEGPQTVSRHGEDVVVVLSVEQYALLQQRQISLKDLLPHLAPEGVDIERSKDLPRDIDL